MKTTHFQTSSQSRQTFFDEHNSHKQGKVNTMHTSTVTRQNKKYSGEDTTGTVNREQHNMLYTQNDKHQIIAWKQSVVKQ